MDLRPIAQVVAVEPAGPDGHGVNWLDGKPPKPGDLLYRAEDINRGCAGLREAAQNALVTLDGIADTNPRDTADFETPAEWITWAKSRAKWAADKLRAPISRELLAERVLKQMLEQDAALTQPAQAGEVPLGAIVNGREHARRLVEHYAFKDPRDHMLEHCHDWIELMRCFECLADCSQRTTPPASQEQADTVPLAKFNELLMQEHALSHAYVRLRHILGAMDPPRGSDAKAVWAYVEGVAQQKVAASQEQAQQPASLFAIAADRAEVAKVLRRVSRAIDVSTDDRTILCHAAAMIELDGQAQQPSGGEVVAWVRFHSDGSGNYDGPLMDTDCRMSDTRRSFWTRLSSATPKPEPMTWQPIDTAPENTGGLVVVRWLDSDGAVCNELDHTEDGCWMGWHEHAEQVEIFGGHGVSYTPPYTHWMPLPDATGITSTSTKEPQR